MIHEDNFLQLDIKSKHTVHEPWDRDGETRDGETRGTALLTV